MEILILLALGLLLFSGSGQVSSDLPTEKNQEKRQTEPEKKTHSTETLQDQVNNNKKLTAKDLDESAERYKAYNQSLPANESEWTEEQRKELQRLWDENQRIGKEVEP